MREVPVLTQAVGCLAASPRALPPSEECLHCGYSVGAKQQKPQCFCYNNSNGK